MPNPLAWLAVLPVKYQALHVLHTEMVISRYQLYNEYNYSRMPGFYISHCTTAWAKLDCQLGKWILAKIHFDVYNLFWIANFQSQTSQLFRHWAMLCFIARLFFTANQFESSHVIFTPSKMGFFILERWHLYTESWPRFLFTPQSGRYSCPRVVTDMQGTWVSLKVTPMVLGYVQRHQLKLTHHLAVASHRNHR